jgi:hypothetical protein
MKYPAAAFLVILLWLGSGTLAQYPPGRLPQKSGPPSPVPEVTIRSQPDAALRVVSAKTSWALPGDESGIGIFILVENVGDRVIRAFATRRNIVGGTGCFLNNLSPGKVLRRGQTDGKSSWQGYSRDAPSPTIWVDFIEFSDNSTWGADDCQCADRLAGEREGAQTMRALLLKLLIAEGPEAVLRLLNEREEKIKAARVAGKDVDPKEINLVEPSPGRSTVFEEGFRAGASTIIGRVEVANQEWGTSEIEAALRRPYDASEVK